MAIEDQRSSTKGTILVVDDNPSNLNLLSRLLTEHGYDVRPAISGSLALRSLKSALPDLILLDIKMPEMDGYEVCTHLKADGRTKNVPVVFVSAVDELIDKVRAFNVGGVDYITKPFQFEEVLARVGTHVALRKMQRYEEEKNRELQNEISERKRIEAELRFLSSRLLTIQEEERQRTAKEIHDNLSQSHSAIKIYVENALYAIANEDLKGAEKTLQLLIPMLQNAIEDTRRIYMGLRPSTLDDLGIIATLRMFCRELQAVYQNLNIEELIEIEEGDIPQELKIMIFRITEEALHNAVKYSQAESVHLTLALRQNAIELIIEDDGVGFDLSSSVSPSDHTRSIGLSSMRERAELSGGTFSIRSAQGEGTAVMASWPCNGKERAANRSKVPNHTSEK